MIDLENLKIILLRPVLQMKLRARILNHFPKVLQLIIGGKLVESTKSAVSSSLHCTILPTSFFFVETTEIAIVVGKANDTEL